MSLDPLSTPPPSAKYALARDALFKPTSGPESPIQSCLYLATGASALKMNLSLQPGITTH